MTLYRQLLATMLALFAVLFVSAYMVQFNSTRSYLTEQLSLSVSSTANSVGLALTPYLETADKVGAESVINAAFDGGFYKRFRLELLADNSVIERENSSTVQDVPDWFVKLKLFSPVKYESVLTAGWLQLGKLEVEGNPGQAYYELWKGMSELLISFLIAFVGTILLLMLALRYLLKPLEQIRDQALEIEKHHFGNKIPLPRTLELKQVVQSINNLTYKLANQFKEQSLATERLRERAFLDVVSGLGNRAYFMGQVNSWIAEGGYGGVMLIAVDMLDTIYRDEGFAARDQMVSSVAVSLKELLKPYNGYALARISATEYAALLPGLRSDDLLDVGEQVNRVIAELVISPVEPVHIISVVGIAERDDEEDISILLTKADNALRKARTERSGFAIASLEVNTSKMGRLAWRNLLELAIQQKLFRFKVQPAILLNSNEPHHAELFTSIHHEGKDYFAGEFMPALEQFRLGIEFDKEVLHFVSVYLEKEPGIRIAVNLTATSISSPAFIEWLKVFMQQHSKLSTRLYFELPESAILHSRQQVTLLIDLIIRSGFLWGVDQYGRNFQSLEYLESLRPSYVKVDYGYTGMLLKDEGDQAFLSAVCRTAHHAGAITFATRVEDQKQVQVLHKFFVDGYQGFIQPPYPI